MFQVLTIRKHLSILENGRHRVVARSWGLNRHRDECGLIREVSFRRVRSSAVKCFTGDSSDVRGRVDRHMLLQPSCRAREVIRESRSSNVLTAVKRISRAVYPKQAREPLSSITYLSAANLKVGTMFDDSTSQECAPESQLLGQATRAFPDRLNRRPSTRRS